MQEQVYMGRYICLFVRLSACLSVSLWDYQNAQFQLEKITTLIIFLSTHGPWLVTYRATCVNLVLIEQLTNKLIDRQTDQG